MESKIIEIRDSGSFIPALAVRFGSANEQERWLMASAGFGREMEDQQTYVALVKIAGGEPCHAHIDPFAWPESPRTYRLAHLWIRDNFDSIEPGAVVDVQYIQHETTAPKTTDRYPVKEPANAGD